MKRLALLFVWAAAALGQSVPESAREIPVAYEVDVVVVGGSSGAVAAAAGAAEKGARVFLAAPRPYLGEDLCATMRLWLEPGEEPGSPLARRLFPEGRGPYRPLHIKKTLDETLLAAKVQYLFSSYVTDVLKDRAGRPAGVVMVNRAGRQAVLAKVIIDATARAAVARLAGARFRPYPVGLQTFQRYVAGGEAAAGENVSIRRTGMVVRDDKGSAEILEYTLRIPMPDGSFASFARAEQIARDMTYSHGEQANTEELFQVPPDPVRARKPARGGWKGAGGLDLEALRPAGVQRLLVVSGAADVPREQAALLMRPLALMEVGRRAGEAAAAEAAGLGRPSGVQVSGSGKKAAGRGDVKESLLGVRGTGEALGKVPSAARGLAVLASYDVVVVGGGTGGAPAGIAAARSKSRTLGRQHRQGLGGVGTLGLISKYYWGFRGGFTRQVPGGADWGPLQKAEWWRRSIRESGGDVWFGVLGCGAVVEEGKVKGVVVATPEGRGVVLAKVVIDSTGNADIAAAAGAETVYTDSSELAQQGTGLPSVRLGARYTNTDFTITDETDMVDIWHLMVFAKNKYGGAFDLGQLVDTRERRRIVGDFTMTILDQFNQRTYPDTISVAYSNFDTHGYTVDPYLLLAHPERKGVTVRVPYRCLLPKGLEGILVTGLGASVHRDALPLVRMQPDIQNQGYAAGLAAATAAREGKAPRAIDVRALQRQLVELEIVPPSTLQERDSYPIPREQVEQAVRDLKDVAVILAQPEVASPLLREAYRNAATGADKLAYAQVLAVLGDNTGLETLAAALETERWDKGWNYTGMGQFGQSLSAVDRLIVALGRTRDRRAVGAILAKAGQLDASSDFSHHRAVALALEMIGDPSAAAPLAAVLSKPGMRGHAQTSVEKARDMSGLNPNDNSVRQVSLRELALARALYRCGDRDGLGKATLEEYARDLRGHVSRHAKAVLAEGKLREKR